MPVLVNFLLTLFGAILTWFSKLFAKKVAFFLTAVAGVVLAFGVMKASLIAIVASISYAVPPQVPVVMSWVVPDNWANCLAAYVAARTAIWVFKWAMNIQLQSALISGA